MQTYNDLNAVKIHLYLKVKLSCLASTAEYLELVLTDTQRHPPCKCTVNNINKVAQRNVYLYLTDTLDVELSTT